MTTNKHPHLILALALPFTLVLASGCDQDALDDELDLDDHDELRSAPLWQPQAIDPELCNNPEFTPSLPPESGSCEIEVRLDSVKLVDGQGVSEGRAELTFDYVGEVPGSGTSTGGTYPTPSTNPLVTTYNAFNPGQTQGVGRSLGTYTVAVGDHEVVEVCITATELDQGGLNGQDDVAEFCENVVLGCDAQTGQPTFTQKLGPEPLCGPNSCNGSVSATIEVMRIDADGDGVPNPDDVTPELCDEHDKGTEGVALIQYFHYGDDGISGLAQSVGTNLSKHYGAYDYVVLVADNYESNQMNANAEAFSQADIVFTPTRDGLMDAFQDVISRGYRFDVQVHSHGTGVGLDDAQFEVLAGDEISGEWLVTATDPNLVGTARGGYPIVAHWATACFVGHQTDAWTTIGAKVSSGAQNVSFYPNTFGNFWDAWVSGVRYAKSVNDALTNTIISVANTYIAGEGALFPYFCTGANGVLHLNSCAEDFFNDDVGPNDAAYNLERVYDHSQSGAANMLISSSRMYSGNTSISFGGANQNWP